MVKISGGPGQANPPLVLVKVGVTVTVAIIVALVLFTVANAGILPVPDVPAPILELICHA